MNLLHFVLCAYGLTMIVVYGSIFERFRQLMDKAGFYGKLYRCPLCFGFWAGVFLWSINPFTELFTFEINIANAFLLGGVSSGTSYVLSMLFGDWGLRHEHIKNKKNKA